MFLKFPLLLLLSIMKEKILNKATDMFLTLGFKSVTMDDLANELGISKKTIYAHYPNKTILVEASTSFLMEKISSAIENICDFNKNPIEELYEIKKSMAMHLKGEKTAPQYQLQKYYPKIYQNIREKQHKVMLECSTKNIITGMDTGIYRENLNPDFVSRIYFSGAISIKDEKLFPSEDFSKPKLMDDYLEYHLRGIVTPKGREILNTIINSNQQ